MIEKLYKKSLSKKLLIIVMFLFVQNIYAADCDKPKLNIKKAKIEEDGGCKLEISESLIICLMEAKTDKAKDLCTKKEKDDNCKKISEKYPKEKNIATECSFLYSDKKIACLLKKNDFDFCQKIDLIKKVKKDIKNIKSKKATNK